MVKKELEWLMRVVGPTRFAEAQNYGMTVEEIKSVLDNGAMHALLELCSIASSLYKDEGVETLLREPYHGLTQLSPIELLQSPAREDLFTVHKIIERLRQHA